MPSPVPARFALVTAAVATLAVAGCTSRETTSTTSANGGPAASATSSAPTAGGCTLAQTGYPKVDLKTAVIGFSQSEKEANPFRITETQSIRDEAAKQG
ncbi:MAG TPA: LacI family transcriptional regulator, partial [Amycolatopsis sp.]|nr:LacI family transcriptional regulator [Amycolatopsis sp.]